MSPAALAPRWTAAGWHSTQLRRKIAASDLRRKWMPCRLADSVLGITPRKAAVIDLPVDRPFVALLDDRSHIVREHIRVCRPQRWRKTLHLLGQLCCTEHTRLYQISRTTQTDCRLETLT